MKQAFKSMTLLISKTCILILAATLALYLSGVRINTSKSIPLGLYWMAQRTVLKGDYVLFCPPQRPLFKEALARGYIHAGFCPGGYGYMMKQVLATESDTVSFTPDGVWVNGKRLAYSVPLRVDLVHRTLPQLKATSQILHAEELLLMTDQSELSFDARYFGLLPKSQVKAVILPIFTWSSQQPIL